MFVHEMENKLESILTLNLKLYIVHLRKQMNLCFPQKGVKLLAHNSSHLQAFSILTGGGGGVSYHTCPTPEQKTQKKKNL